MNDWEDIRSWIVTLIFGILIGWLYGWLHAHNTVANECKKLGSFYVGKTIFKCAEIEQKDKDE